MIINDIVAFFSYDNDGKREQDNKSVRSHCGWNFEELSGLSVRDAMRGARLIGDVCRTVSFSGVVLLSHLHTLGKDKLCNASSYHLQPPPARQHLSPLIINAARRVVLHFHVALLLPQRGFEVILELTLTSNAAASYLNTLIELNGFARKRTGLRIVLTRYAIELSRIAHNYAGERRESAAD